MLNKLKLKKAYLLLVLAFLYAPIFILMLFSFNASRTRGTWGGFSLTWYFALFQDRNIAQALYNTVTIALLSATIAVIIGTLAAVGINNMRRGTKKIVLGLSSIPVANPDIVTGVSLLILYMSVFRLTDTGRLGYTTLLLAHIAFNIPYVILSVLPRFKHMDKHLYEAAMDLGASPGYAFLKVVVPQLMPGIITGWVLAFTLSVDDFMVSFFTTGAGVSNLSLIIFSMARTGVNPMINALSTLMFVFVMILLFIINKKGSMKLSKKMRG
ncbi:MAG: ABC transporter permease [Defluviitaleaceae bacterium]|nr:ABC transporter permease [Defluviitaleaceae bacterium]